MTTHQNCLGEMVLMTGYDIHKSFLNYLTSSFENVMVVAPALGMARYFTNRLNGYLIRSLCLRYSYQAKENNQKSQKQRLSWHYS